MGTKMLGLGFHPAKRLCTVGSRPSTQTSIVPNLRCAWSKWEQFGLNRAKSGSKNKKSYLGRARAAARPHFPSRAHSPRQKPFSEITTNTTPSPTTVLNAHSNPFHPIRGYTLPLFPVLFSVPLLLCGKTRLHSSFLQIKFTVVF